MVAKTSTAFSDTLYFDNHNSLSSHVQKAKIADIKAAQTEGEGGGVEREINSFKNMRNSSLSLNCSRCLSDKLVMTPASRGNNASDAKPRKPSPDAG